MESCKVRDAEPSEQRELTRLVVRATQHAGYDEAFDAAADLLSRVGESSRLVKRCPSLSPTMPLIVLRHGRPGYLGAGASAVTEGAWVRLQHHLAGQSLAGRLRAVPRSGHLIAVEQPEAVVQAIDDLLIEAATPAQNRSRRTCAPRR